MSSQVEARLRRQKVDVDFLLWLEGADERLPRLERMREISPEDWATAYHSATWLRQFAYLKPKLLQPENPQRAQERYKVLQQFLWGVLEWGMTGRSKLRHKDLEILERVLEALIPAEAWQPYRSDIQRLRKSGQPLWIQPRGFKHTGGTFETEQTHRMRAAVAYLTDKTEHPYTDLASFWNERLKLKRYHGEQIRSRLKKARDATPDQNLKFWQRVYDGDFRDVFLAPFPLHPKLAERSNGK